MDLKLNVQKRGLSTTAETINEEFTLHYGHIFKGEKGDKGEKGVDGKDGERGADGKSAYQQAVEAGYKGSEADFKELLLSYPNKADKDGYYPNMSVGIADDVKDGNTKYLAATPSGDPMHYAYEAIGAVWNADTGYWEFIGVNDMTNEDMREEILLGNNRIYSAANLINLATIERVIFGRVNLLLDAEWNALSADNLAPFNERLEVIQFSTRKNDVVFIQSFGWGCYGCKRLRSFFNIMDVSKANIGSAFGGCVALETIMLRGLNKDVSFADSPLLSKESLLYMIRNSVQGVEITITLHPAVYQKAKEGEWEEEVTSAINDYGENITLAEA